METNPAQNVSPDTSERLSALERENVWLRQIVEYLYYWSIRSDEYLRDLIAQTGGHKRAIERTKDIFTEKWTYLNKGDYARDHYQGTTSLDNPAHRAEIEDVVLRWTGLPRQWFPGKRVLDAGCGDGRLSYGFCSLGAHVTSVDQSQRGIDVTVAYCQGYPHTGFVHDLLEPFTDHVGPFDLVFSFGVVHCTGDTRKAIANLVDVAAPGGRVALMVYGYPRLDGKNDFLHMIRKEEVRQAVRSMNGPEAIAYIEAWMAKGDIPGNVRGWFDATLPWVEDHYTWPQLEMMLKEAGLVEIRRLEPQLRNLCAIATKPL